LVDAIQAQALDCAIASADVCALPQPLAQASVKAFLVGLSNGTLVAGEMSMPLMLLAWNSTIAEAQLLEMVLIVASGSPPAHRPLTALPTASAHAAVAWFFRWKVLLEKADTRPAPFAE
jgi:hypothetical protein